MERREVVWVCESCYSDDRETLTRGRVNIPGEKIRCEFCGKEFENTKSGVLNAAKLGWVIDGVLANRKEKKSKGEVPRETRYTYIDLGKYDNANEAVKLVKKKFGQEVSDDLIKLLPNVEGFRFSMEGPHPFFEVKKGDEWVDMFGEMNRE